MASILDELLEKRPISFTVLVLFLVDVSHSMTSTRTYNRKRKWDLMNDMITRLTERLEESSLAPTFRVGYVFFNDDVIVVRDEEGRPYITVDDGRALEVYRSAVSQVTPYGATAIADALHSAAEVIEAYIADEELPEEKYVTVFLFTDGKETKRTPEDVLDEASRIHSELQQKLQALDERNRIGLATIALGLDADRETLRAIASFLREAQRKVLEERGLLDLVDPPYHEKLFIDAPRDDRITREWMEAVRRFVERLSETAVY